MSTDVVDSTGQPPEVPGPFGAPVRPTRRRPTLRADTLNLFDSTVVAVSSVAPAYTLAATMAVLFLTAGIGYAGPAVIWIAFIPVLFIAISYFHLNRRDPDCGASYSWLSKLVPRTWAGSTAGSRWPPASSSACRPRSWPASTPCSSSTSGAGSRGSTPTRWAPRPGRRRLAGPHHLHLHLGHPVDHQLPVGAAHHRVRGRHRLLLWGIIKVAVNHPAGSTGFHWSWLNPFSIHGIAALPAGAGARRLLLLGLGHRHQPQRGVEERHQDTGPCRDHLHVPAPVGFRHQHHRRPDAAARAKAWNAHQSTILLYFAQQAAGHWPAT